MTYLKPLEIPLVVHTELRFFSDENYTPEADAFSQHTEQPNPLLGGGEIIQESPVIDSQQPTVETPSESELLDFGGIELEANDTTRGLHQAFTQMQEDLQRQAADFNRAQQMLDQYQSFMQQQQVIQQPQQEATPTVSQERMQELHERYQEMAYENKLAADQWWQQQPEVQAMEQQRFESLVQQRVNEVLGPMQQEREIQQQLNQARTQYADFESYTEAMNQLLESNPQLAEYPNAIDNLYWIAKGRAAQSAPTPEQMLSDPSFQQQIIQNEQIKNMILQSYQQQKVQQQPPVVITNQAAAQIPSNLGEKKPSNLTEASDAFTEYLARQTMQQR